MNKKLLGAVVALCMAGSAQAQSDLVSGLAGRLNNAATYGARSVAYQNSASGAVARTVQDKLAEHLSVLDFPGCDRTGVASSSACVQAAINAAPNNSVIEVPAGIYRVTGLSISGHNNITLQGMGGGNNAAGGVTFLSDSATANLLTASSVSGVWVRNIAFSAPTPMTAGSLVDFESCASSGMSDFYMQNGFNPLVVNNSGGMWFNVGSIRDFNGIGATVNGAQDQYFDHIIMDQDSSSYTPQAGFYSNQNGGSMVVTNSDILHTHFGYWANPGAGQFVNWPYMSNVFFDTTDWTNNGGVGIKITPHGGGQVNGGSFENVWTATATTGLYMVGDASSPISGIQFTNLRAVHNYGSAIVADYADKVSFVNVAIAGNSLAGSNTYSAVVPNAHAGALTFIGGYIGTGEAYGATQKYGIDIQPGYTGALVVDGVNLTGNVSGPVYNGGSPGAGSRIINSPGFNPVGPTLVTVGASPWSYSAGLTPEHVNIYGGTGVVATVAGVALMNTSPGAFTLAPGQTVSITYSTAPTMAVNKE